MTCDHCGKPITLDDKFLNLTNPGRMSSSITVHRHCLDAALESMRINRKPSFTPQVR